MTPEQCAEMFGLLDAAYPKERMTEQQMALYTMTLAPYEVARVREAVMLHIHISPWFPRISDIVDKLIKQEQLDPTEAWGEVVRKIRSVGIYQTPTWSHPALAKAVQAMGWTELCMSDNPEADRAHFLRFYEATAARERDNKVLGQMDALNPDMRDMLGLIGKPVPGLRAIGTNRKGVE